MPRLVRVEGKTWEEKLMVIAKTTGSDDLLHEALCSAFERSIPVSFDDIGSVCVARRSTVPDYVAHSMAQLLLRVADGPVPSNARKLQAVVDALSPHCATVPNVAVVIIILLKWKAEAIARAAAVADGKIKLIAEEDVELVAKALRIVLALASKPPSPMPTTWLPLTTAAELATISSRGVADFMSHVLYTLQTLQDEIIGEVKRRYRHRIRNQLASVFEGVGEDAMRMMMGDDASKIVCLFTLDHPAIEALRPKLVASVRESVASAAASARGLLWTQNDDLDMYAMIRSVRIMNADTIMAEVPTYTAFVKTLNAAMVDGGLVKFFAARLHAIPLHDTVTMWGACAEVTRTGNYSRAFYAAVLEEHEASRRIRAAPLSVKRMVIRNMRALMAVGENKIADEKTKTTLYEKARALFDTCDVCSARADTRPTKYLLVCAQCMNGKYCSRACQKADWRVGRHKAVCAPASGGV